MEAKEGFEFVRKFPKGEHVIEMLKYKTDPRRADDFEKVLIATNRTVYEFSRGQLVPVEIEIPGKPKLGKPEYIEINETGCNHKWSYSADRKRYFCINPACEESVPERDFDTSKFVDGGS